jgi:tetratricopeptide (TPR) repeat protein
VRLPAAEQQALLARPASGKGSTAMNKVKLVFAPILVIAIIAGSYLFSLHGQSDRKTPSHAGSGRPSADTSIAFWQKRIAENPEAYLDYVQLGEAFGRKARETGDVGYYQRSEAALRRALSINPKYVQASAMLSNILFTMHDFKGALALAEPLANNPRAVQALATVGDVHLALGDYAEAEAAFQKLLLPGPNPSVYSRLAVLADLHGDPERALSLMEKAADLARRSGGYGESMAWYEYQLGELHFKSGRLEQAETHYQAALDQFDNYYLALAGLGKIRAAQGNYQAAIDLYKHSIAIVPQPEFLGALGDVYTASGQPDQARQQYATVEYIGKLAKINEQIYNRQLANFYSDHDMHLEEALRLATSELDYRQDVFGFDAAAWAYYKNGKLSQAQDAMVEAMKFGTRDAKLYYHAGMIAYAQGRGADAQRLLSEALAINSHFDVLQAPMARQMLAELSAAARK